MNKPTLLALAAALATLAAPSAHALYKVVHPDGRISYSDRPPEQASSGKSAARVTSVTPGSSALNDVALPYEVRQASLRFPVTLYTAEGCDPCMQARELLVRRGIPFSERKASTPADRAAWKSTTGSTEAPVLAVGGERVPGFNAASWNSTLDAAGYPATSKLPSTYRQADAGTIAAPREVAEPKKPIRPAPEPVAAPPAPGGIRF